MKVAIRVRPGARAEHVGGRWDGPRGPALLVSVRARAVEGAANTAVVAAVAAAFGIRRADVELVSGARGRDKVLALTGDEPALRARLVQLLA
ncbi:hypothetical protein GCM10009609_55580 [Pseudonocardia aurantiaca]|uniref:UPF0235 protein ACFSCY_08130 n=1 Tax=Pseudonocardia aurantiaca TaxID=75290 RepID=A0ABW4FFL6_9PSEU